VRAKIEVSGSGYERTDVVAEVTFDFTARLREAGLDGAFDEAHLRLVETDAEGQVLDESLPFQFDPNPDYDPASNASGKLVMLLQDHTGAEQIRHLFAYFDTVDNENGKEPAVVPPRVSYVDNVLHEGQVSYEIATDSATYYYHRNGAGFASLVDAEGYDWISYHPEGGAAGEYRGIPNVATNNATGGTQGLFHPGYSRATSTVLHSGPIKVTIESITDDGDWEKTWEIYPRSARMTLQRKPAGKRYWFLYEGTPGGSIDTNDYYVLADGLPQHIDTPIQDDLPGEEWLYFGDPVCAAVLFLVNHKEDDLLDCHTVMQDQMTVFGFGRKLRDVSFKALESVPGRFTIGFLPAADHQTLAQRIRSAYKPLDVGVGPGEAAPAP
jgi:hypothetical protein